MGRGGDQVGRSAWRSVQSRPLRRFRRVDAGWSRHALRRWHRDSLRQSQAVRLPDHLRRSLARGGFGRAGCSRTEETTAMTEAELLALRSVLADRRCALLDRLAVALLDRLAITAAGTDRNVEPGFLRLLVDLHTII